MFRPPNAFGAPPLPPQPRPWLQQQPPPPSPAVSFWKRDNVRDHVQKLKETIEVSSALINELEEIAATRNPGDATAQESDSSSAKPPSGSSGDKSLRFVELARSMGVSQDVHESMATDAANYLCHQLQHLLAPISSAISQSGPWEERSAMVRLTQKLQKAKRNKRWRKRKRKHVAELFQKERADYDRIDQEADEWRAKQIAKDIAKRKVESMKQIARKKANEERKRLESELELALMVEKLQELRSIRVQKMKKQGHFLPEEDDKYLERVKAAVEEEERQAATAARTDAVKDAILTAEESRKAPQPQDANPHEDDSEQSKSGPTKDKNQGDIGISERNDQASQKTEHEGHKIEGKGHGHHDPVSNLPFEFYHYYHGSSYDMGTLIEVRRMWDSFIRPGGSRIPGHWVQPPPPADEIWASYLAQPK
ncbi:U11/U12 small nuclear ribonucleoprotein 59 kDa protein [Dichanthelium oligosanthes]|uniref:U11/U12 small nuclear ribonucleoprotein 59 kDa protein n=1 Tax=Dichanthelium oligosanthes TaxID=888268 RepID=A0A1E5VBQ2_9POAL|nr:U11/U12 small nuclear ribonucleoprotein 59 kDa protein [Dichanthelium oligosanthes]